MNGSQKHFLVCTTIEMYRTYTSLESSIALFGENMFLACEPEVSQIVRGETGFRIGGNVLTSHD